MQQHETQTLFLLHSASGRIALRKRPAKGILAGLWEYPSVPGTLSQTAAAKWLTGQNLEFDGLEKTGSRKHVFTHVEWHMTVWRAKCRTENPLFTWVTAEEQKTAYPLPSAFKGFC